MIASTTVALHKTQAQLFRASLCTVAADPELFAALEAAANSLSSATDEQKTAIRAADIKRAVAGLALATLAVDAGRLVIDIAGVVKEVADKDASVLDEVTNAELSLQAIQLWPEQVKQLVASANAFGKAAKETDKALKSVYKKAKTDPPKAADVKQALSAAGDE